MDDFFPAESVRRNEDGGRRMHEPSCVMPERECGGLDDDEDEYRLYGDTGIYGR